MHPVLERKVVHPPVHIAAMVRNDVHDYSQSLLASLVDEGLVEFVRAEARVDVIVVRSCISVI